jgi:hypothetical protein
LAASMKLSILISVTRSRTAGRTPWTGDQLVARSAASGDCEDGEVGGMKWFWKGKPKCSEKTCPDATLSTTNPTWPDPVANPGRRGWKPANNRFSYGAGLLKSIKLSKTIRRLCMWRWFTVTRKVRSLNKRERRWATDLK